MSYKDKYKKYKTRYVEEKKKISKYLRKYIKLHIKNHLTKKFRIVPDGKIFKDQLKDLFNGYGTNVSIISPDWGKDYNKRNNKLNISIENKIMELIRKQLLISEWNILLLPFNFNFNKLINIFDLENQIIHKKGNLVIIFISSNIPYNYNLPKFKLQDVNKKMLSNKDYEINEQMLLFKYLDKNDSVLQLGGNIGTSCILVDKIIKGNNICVEPNTGLIPLLKKNKEMNNANFVIIDGIISKKEGMMIVESDDDNKFGSYISKNKGKIVKNYDFNKLNKKYNFTVLFADCEGCLESFFDEYPESLNIFKKIIFEKDREEDCNYNKIIKLLKVNGFVHHEGDFHQVYLHE